MATTQTFLTDVKELRKRARQHMDRGALTQSYELDPKQVVDILNQALATEIVCVLRYKRHFYSAKGLNKDAVAAEFLAHASEEQGHADRISERITQLGGDPDLNPATLTTRAHSEYQEGDDLISMIKENLVAER
ncbi:MAG: ferritin-like domain-containing protein, partial [Candidatus Baltobacteraceae bacterium]